MESKTLTKKWSLKLLASMTPICFKTPKQVKISSLEARPNKQALLLYSDIKYRH